MINYKIEKSKQSNSWIIWKEVIKGHGIGIYPVYRGRTKKECKEVLLDIKLHRHKRNIKIDVIEKEYIFNRVKENRI